MFPLSILNQFAIMLSLFTATGVALHDTKVDKAFSSSAMAASIIKRTDSSTTNLSVSSDLHTHAHRVSLSQAVQDIQGNTPRIQPREDHKKHVTPKNVVRGHHAFDNYSLPLV